MTVEAQNALLKLIEEPPPQTLFLLIAEQLAALLPTVRSRCAAIYFAPVAPGHIADLLVRDHSLAPDLARDLAAASEGAPGTAKLLATRPDEAKARLELADLAASAPRLGVFARLLLAGRLATTKADLARFGQLLQAQVVADTRAGELAPATAARQLEALERFRQQLQAKVAPRVAVERLMLGL